MPCRTVLLLLLLVLVLPLSLVRLALVNNVLGCLYLPPSSCTSSYHLPLPSCFVLLVWYFFKYSYSHRYFRYVFLYCRQHFVTQVARRIWLRIRAHGASSAKSGYKSPSWTLVKSVQFQLRYLEQPPSNPTMAFKVRPTRNKDSILTIILHRV